MNAAYLGIDLGGSNIYGALFDAELKPLAHDKVDTEARQGEAVVLARIAGQIERLNVRARELALEVKGVGLCAPGVVDMAAGVVRTAPNLGWTNVRPANAINSPAPLALVNDVNAGLLGELSELTAPPTCSVAYFCGTGVGGAIHYRGELITGARGGAGEVGHMVVRVGGRKVDVGVRGSLEAYIGKWALNRKIQARFSSGKRTLLRELIDYNLSRTPVKSSSLKKAYEAGDRYVRELMEDYYARHLGAGLSQAANFIEPELIILGGGMMEAMGQALLPHIERHMRKHCIAAPPELRLARLGDLAGPKGAAVFAKQLCSSS